MEKRIGWGLRVLAGLLIAAASWSYYRAGQNWLHPLLLVVAIAVLVGMTRVRVLTKGQVAWITGGILFVVTAVLTFLYTVR